MPYREFRGNIFNSKAEALVNTVNCVGVMGKGIALEFRRRYPAMFQEYKRVCDRQMLRPGQILPYQKQRPWILNFAIKDEWRRPSKLVWIETCLRKFVAAYPEWQLRSVAFPWMGAMNGGLPIDDIKRLTRQYLENLDDIDVEVYDFDPAIGDSLFDRLKAVLMRDDGQELARASGIRGLFITRITEAVEKGTATSLTTLISATGMGETTVEKLYAYLTELKIPPPDMEGPHPEQLPLF